DGNDMLGGGGGNDLLYGGAGDDLLAVAGSSHGNDVFDGGSGFDTLDVQGGFVSLTSSTISGIEHVRSSSGTGELFFSLFLTYDQVIASGINTITGSLGEETLSIEVPNGGGSYTMPNFAFADWTTSLFGDTVGLVVGLSATGNYTLHAREGLA